MKRRWRQCFNIRICKGNKNPDYRIFIALFLFICIRGSPPVFPFNFREEDTYEDGKIKILKFFLQNVGNLGMRPTLIINKGVISFPFWKGGELE